MEKIANRLREIIEADERKHNGQKISQYEREDLEKKFILKYAKENNLWINDIYSLGNSTGLRGNENTILVNIENNVVYKSNNLFNARFLISNLLNQIIAHNQLFPETKYELVGFTGIDNGIKRTPYIEVVLKQDLVKDATQASEEEIVNFMNSLGFIQIGEAKFSSGEYIVADLHPRNVLKDSNGVIYVVDDIIFRVE
jgi:Serine/Threonine/Tyrosine Kinase found in polyvalent proteins